MQQPFLPDLILRFIDSFNPIKHPSHNYFFALSGKVTSMTLYKDAKGEIVGMGIPRRQKQNIRGRICSTHLMQICLILAFSA